METGIPLKLTGTDGNAFAIIGAACKALKQAGKADLVEEFRTEATSGTYDNVLAVCYKWFEVS